MNKEEFLARLKGVKSADDIIALANESGIEIAPEKAQELFDQINSNCELSDEELDKVAGGDLKDKLKKRIKELLF